MPTRTNPQTHVARGSLDDCRDGIRIDLRAMVSAMTEFNAEMKAWNARMLAQMDRMERIAATEERRKLAREKYEAAKQVQLTLFPRGQW